MKTLHCADDLGLSGRDLQVLRAIIHDYIDTAEPVGSRALTRAHSLDVSPATVRNVMADLEHLGYLHKPHTSAGRVPTAKAFRFYVDTMLQVRPLPSRTRAEVEQAYLEPVESVDGLLQQTVRVLHRLTRHVAVVAAPRIAEAVYRQIRFVRLRDNRVLAILVTSSGLVQNRLLLLEFDITQGDLDRATRYLDELLENQTITEVRRRIAAAREEDRVAYDELAAKALELGRQALSQDSDSRQGEVVVEGQSSVLDLPEFDDREKVRSLLQALEEKELLLRVLERAEDSHGIQIFIGRESDIAGEDVSMVLASYQREEQVLGALGVIGPTRMDYSRVVASVKFTAQQLSRVFGSG